MNSCKKILLSPAIKEYKLLFQSGKTLLANFLADATEAPSDDYRPTHVVRVLEFEVVRLIFNLKKNLKHVGRQFFRMST